MESNTSSVVMFQYEHHLGPNRFTSLITFVIRWYKKQEIVYLKYKAPGEVQWFAFVPFFIKKLLTRSSIYRTVQVKVNYIVLYVTLLKIQKQENISLKTRTWWIPEVATRCIFESILEGYSNIHCCISWWVAQSGKHTVRTWKEWKHIEKVPKSCA